MMRPQFRIFSGYIASGSDVDIVDTAAEILSAGNAILDDLGVDSIAVSGGPVDAATGELLGDLNKNVAFDILDDANDIASQIMGASNGPGDLDEAITVVVSSGNVDVASADAIQDISGYVGTMSDYDITDTSAAIISAMILY